jgi:hypothetical protein
VVFVETSPAIEQGGGNVLAQNPKTYLDCTVSLTPGGGRVHGHRQRHRDRHPQPA